MRIRSHGIYPLHPSIAAFALDHSLHDCELLPIAEPLPIHEFVEKFDLGFSWYLVKRFRGSFHCALHDGHPDRAGCLRLKPARAHIAVALDVAATNHVLDLLAYGFLFLVGRHIYAAWSFRSRMNVERPIP